MYSKSLLIAVAAMAVSATSAQAYSGEVLARARLTEEQQAAFAVARELREEGDFGGAKEVLIEAGIDEEVIERVKAAFLEIKKESQTALRTALQGDDFDSFLEAVADTPLGDLITTKEDFARFKEAYELQNDGDKMAAGLIFSELGLSVADIVDSARNTDNWPTRSQLSSYEEEALQVARAANDSETVRAILEEAGLEMPTLYKRLKDGKFFTEE